MLLAVNGVSLKTSTADGTPLAEAVKERMRLEITVRKGAGDKVGSH